jgi:hypothetical protein
LANGVHRSGELLGGQRTEDRRQKTEDRRQKTEDRGQRTEDRIPPFLVVKLLSSSKEI